MFQNCPHPQTRVRTHAYRRTHAHGQNTHLLDSVELDIHGHPQKWAALQGSLVDESSWRGFRSELPVALDGSVAARIVPEKPVPSVREIAKEYAALVTSASPSSSSGGKKVIQWPAMLLPPLSESTKPPHAEALELLQAKAAAPAVGRFCVEPN